MTTEIRSGISATALSAAFYAAGFSKHKVNRTPPMAIAAPVAVPTQGGNRTAACAKRHLPRAEKPSVRLCAPFAAQIERVAGDVIDREHSARRCARFMPQLCLRYIPKRDSGIRQAGAVIHILTVHE